MSRCVRCVALNVPTRLSVHRQHWTALGCSPGPGYFDARGAADNNRRTEEGRLSETQGKRSPRDRRVRVTFAGDVGTSPALSCRAERGAASGRNQKCLLKKQDVAPLQRSRDIRPRIWRGAHSRPDFWDPKRIESRLGTLSARPSALVEMTREWGPPRRASGRNDNPRGLSPGLLVNSTCTRDRRAMVCD